MSKHITIKSTHATISEAVAAAGLDLSSGNRRELAALGLTKEA